MTLAWSSTSASRAAVARSPLAMAFSQRRKVLRNTLGRWLEERSFSGQFDLQRRAEEVTVSEYLSLCVDLAQASAGQ
mgnify:CR=1 FL=1